MLLLLVFDATMETPLAARALAASMSETAIARKKNGTQVLPFCLTLLLAIRRFTGRSRWSIPKPS